jgi:acetyl esterase/lipase
LLKDGITLISKSTAVYDIAVEPDFNSPLWSPLLWPTGHKDLPPMFFQICGADLLRDKVLIYERELRLENRVKTRTIVYQGLPHIF